jgi:hypothetical protein
MYLLREAFEAEGDFCQGLLGLALRVEGKM